MTRVVLAGAIVVLHALGGRAVLVHAQQVSSPASPSQEFEVASIKPNRSGDEVGRMVVTGGMFRASNVSVRSLIAMAFGNGRSLFKNQIDGGPEWISSDRFDVIAKAEGSVRDLRSAAPLIRRLLEERFQLRTHPEKQQQPVYALIRLRPDGALGSSLNPSTVDCADPAVRASVSAAASNAGPLICRSQFGDGSIDAGGFTMSLLASAFSSTLDRMVIDETGLSGLFDLSLRWNPNPAGVADDRPALYTAIEEQLGLKLDPRRMPVDVVVIDDVQRPTPN